MHYDPEKNDHGLPQGPFKSCVLPRPIGWISTISADGVSNLAPYSQFQNLTFDPPYVMISINQTTSGRRKDTTINIEQTGEFVYNMCTYDQREAVNESSAEFPPDVDEFEVVGMTKAPSLKVKSLRVAESPIHFECVFCQTIRLPGAGKMGTVDVIIGKVVMVHIKDEFITDGKIDVVKIRPLARLGYCDYTTVDSTFEMVIPGVKENASMLVGIHGAKQE